MSLAIQLGLFRAVTGKDKGQGPLAQDSLAHVNRSLSDSDTVFHTYSNASTDCSYGQ